MIRNRVIILVVAMLILSVVIVAHAQNMPQSLSSLSIPSISSLEIGEPDFTVNSTADTVDANPGDGICTDAVGMCTLRAAIIGQIGCSAI